MHPFTMLNSLRLPLAKKQNRVFLILDILAFLITPALALWIRLDGQVSWSVYGLPLLIGTGIFLLLKLIVLRLFGFYRHDWSYASIHELSALAQIAGVIIALQSFVFLLSGNMMTIMPPGLPRSLPFLDGLFCAILVGISRFSLRKIQTTQKQQTTETGIPTLIIGAGMAGTSFVQEAQRNPSLNIHPIAYIDDDQSKFKLQIHGISVVGNRHRIPEVICALQVERIIIAIPTASGTVVRELAEICQSTGISTYTLPSIEEILSNRAHLSDVRELRIEDLLRREPIQTDTQPVKQLMAAKRILITGAGGSIGSELCRQLLQSQPTAIALLGKGENSVFVIHQELLQVMNEMRDRGEATPDLQVFIADIRSRERMSAIFEQFQPNMIFHAAAHKHVPLMETNPPEAITNNILGTQNLVNTATKYGVQHFVMISTDKAVNPTNVMGASKRVAEMIVLSTAKRTGLSYVVVRFGNVLGSRGSVIPTFKRQIEQGGPITVTHPEICRYFMTIPEAVQLVLQAAVLGRGGEVLMLDMGQPIKIVTLAEDLIRLSGYQVGREIKINFSGLRPGEKLYEELFIQGESYERTDHDKILMVRNASHNLPETLLEQVIVLAKAAFQQDIYQIRHLLQQLVPEYTPSQSLARQAHDRAA
ncbi:polysaccharide biosynthesis protein [filamentous cyanobacterium LEGE 11480]|uniref:Polysaccharide biosynthesis protein n=1 Tax=Romeriopsis navalis LEGE 11480 TaxID=2777977 RepID=A0A928VLG6_9CYAN|nr:nucleoside-diphosphate sugar epimerase/dehydratase [Romeriopsis navalis]MBE9028705.1 polysaccharide biosynthesis protein [Romeriopsis navalis LEGE 11480]